ncbi:hypothetical protein J3R83DRAFT_2785 [Lanmaoa asiatica]|nr:hypothetical protein J3R83DRAFT_2785 [Lanmaoa asiatica]
MLKPTSSAPTKRECFLLALLLLALLSLSRASIAVRESRASPLVPENVVQQYGSNLESTSPDVEVPSTESERWRTRVTWTSKQVPSTTIVSHVPGWTIFDNLFLLNGTVFVVTDDPESVPDRQTITSTGVRIDNGAEAAAAHLVDGTTWIVNDPSQFITHYYHWSAELFFGFWRTYSSLDPSISANGSSWLPALRRIWFVHADADHWRDYASMNQWVLRSAFPSATAEYSTDWQDRAEMGRPVILDRVIFSDRAAAMKGLDEGFDEGSKPVITYVSRQEWGRRKLIQEDHEKLVKELYKLRDQHGVEVNVVSMDKLSHAEQLRLAARTTIMMGVHGNGLTSLVWMKPSPQSTVIEFFYPGGFARDYEYTSRALGMVHYGIWDDKTFTNPEVPPVKYPEGFQGNSIPLNGEIVAKLCSERLQLLASTEH